MKYNEAIKVLSKIDKRGILIGSDWSLKGISSGEFYIAYPSIISLKPDKLKDLNILSRCVRLPLNENEVELRVLNTSDEMELVNINLSENDFYSKLVSTTIDIIDKRDYWSSDFKDTLKEFVDFKRTKKFPLLTRNELKIFTRKYDKEFGTNFYEKTYKH